VPFLRKCVGEDGVGGGGPGVSCLSRGVEGWEGLLAVEVLSFSSSSETEAASLQESATGALVAFAFAAGDIERLLKDVSRPGRLL